MRNFILEELADALDDRSGQFRYFFRLANGAVEPYSADDPAILRASADDGVIAVTPLPLAESRMIAVDFVAGLADDDLGRLLREALGSNSPTDMFLRALSAYPRARRSWLAFRQRRLEQLASEWLQRSGVDLTRLGIGRTPRPLESAAGLSFDASLDERLDSVRARVRAFSASDGALRRRLSCRDDEIVDEIFHSNAVRGNRLTRDDLTALLVSGTCAGGLPLNDHLEAVNLRKALARMNELAVSGGPLTEHAIRELHAILFAGIDDERAGSYRTTDTRIVGRDYLPPESVLVPAMLREFVEWLDETDADPVVMASAAQAKILHIAPFLDGNGRIGRLLSAHILARAGYPPAIVRVDDRRRYHEGLRGADAGDLTVLLTLLLDRVADGLLRWSSA